MSNISTINTTNSTKITKKEESFVSLISIDVFDMNYSNLLEIRNGFVKHIINRYGIGMASIYMYVIVRSRDNVAICFVIVAITSPDPPHLNKGKLDPPPF